MTIGMPYVMRLGYGLRKPRSGIRGTDLSGVVEKVGGKAGLWQVGDEVLGWGTRTFAEYAAVDEDHLVAKPTSLSFEEAAAIPMAGSVALQAWRDVAKVEAGDHVLVVGASGGIGTFAVQIAKAMGARVTGVCSTPNVELVESLGADHVIDYTERDFTDDARQYDAILDMADKHTLTQRRLALKTGGTLIPNSGEGGRWFGSLGRIFKAWRLSPLVSGRLRPFLS
ncbi:MAG: NAD(P)-dependent alcohol dehydrogenase, partial [Acidimicrobiia bacterium]|nr:NAD(P)-dependent alcohol dehydrogenase [Acidimicrobiia bacterium]